MHQVPQPMHARFSSSLAARTDLFARLSKLVNNTMHATQIAKPNDKLKLKSNVLLQARPQQPTLWLTVPPDLRTGEVGATVVITTSTHAIWMMTSRKSTVSTSSTLHKQTSTPYSPTSKLYPRQKKSRGSLLGSASFKDRSHHAPPIGHETDPPRVGTRTAL